MLMNLKLIRNENIFEKFQKYYYNFFYKGIYYGDQHIINDLFRDKIGYLHPKYGIWFINSFDIKNYINLKPLKTYNSLKII